VNLELFKFVRLNRASVEPRLSTCDAWCLLFLTLLICITCHMHHGFYITLLTAKIRQPSHEFTFGVGMSFIPYPLVLTPVV
jgi:hypothetical protein